jgi:hypothetical protein
MTRSKILTKPVDLIFLDSRKLFGSLPNGGWRPNEGGGGGPVEGGGWKAGVGYQSGQPAMTWKTRFFLSIHKPKKL